MRTLYLTSDRIGEPTGGGSVTFHELTALISIPDSFPVVISREQLGPRHESVWQDDLNALKIVEERVRVDGDFQLAHVYSGTFSKTVSYLKWKGTKVSYTAAAHSITESKKAHEEVGLSYNYPHLTDPYVFKEYVSGYKNADLVICPSSYSKREMMGYGCKNVEVVPHGCSLPNITRPWPSKFVVGYLGSFGPDKNLKYLLSVFKEFSSPEVSLLLGGRDSISPWASELIRRYGGGNIHCQGWYEDPTDFYDSITAYVQPSASEGFGLEVLEAAAHGRMVACSVDAGACDVLNDIWNLPLRCFNTKMPDMEDHGSLMNILRYFQLIHKSRVGEAQKKVRDEIVDRTARNYQWPDIRERYRETWRKLCNSQ